MTEWNDVKVGELYKRVDESGVQALVVGFEPGPSGRIVWVTLLEEGEYKRVMTMGNAFGKAFISFGNTLYEAVK